jgi:RHS repeat-associated protein
MPMAVRYTVMDGEILSETRNGVQRDYLPDPLGSTVALLDSSQDKTLEVSYWPYGEIASISGTGDTPLLFVGTLGYYRDQANRTYVRARPYRQDLGQWMTVDPLWPIQQAYTYALNAPTSRVDPSGTWPWDLCGYFNWARASCDIHMVLICALECFLDGRLFVGCVKLLFTCRYYCLCTGCIPGLPFPPRPPLIATIPFASE